MKKFNSCFICNVEIGDGKIVLQDSYRNDFYIVKGDSPKSAFDEFKNWFREIYLACIPQTLTVLQYHISENADGESVAVIDRLIYVMPERRK